MIVVDASVLAPALGDDGSDGDRARARLRGERLVAPYLIDLEVTSVWRKQVANGGMTPPRAEEAIADLVDLPMLRAPHEDLLRRCWELRDDVTVYDAAYVAIAEALGALLITADERLARATGPTGVVEVLN